MALQIPTVSLDDLRTFHSEHFPHIPAPEHFLHDVDIETTEDYHDEEDDGLGYYSDGAKRTLSEEQIAMFRHSEIRDILRVRRAQQEDGEIAEEGNALVASTSQSHTATLAGQGSADKVQTGRVEKPQAQQWATSSARTKAKNRRNRDNYKAKKKAAAKLEREKRKEATHAQEPNESDEWDPWHQANGPDAQKHEALDLDY